MIPVESEFKQILKEFEVQKFAINCDSRLWFLAIALNWSAITSVSWKPLKNGSSFGSVTNLADLINFGPVLNWSLNWTEVIKTRFSKLQLL